MKQFAKFYFWYESSIVKSIRVVVLFFLLGLSFYGILSNIHPNFFITFFCLYLIFEIFFIYKISKLTPDVLVSENNSDPVDSFTILAFGIFKSSNIIKNLLNFPQINFILEKSDLSAKEVLISDIDQENISKKALELSKILKGKYITTMDLFVGYLLLTEEKTKLLFNKKLKDKDIINILLWARNTFPLEENPKHLKLNFSGEGVAEDWIYGWTVETSKYMLDLSKEFLKKDELPVGRQAEYSRLIEALSKGSSAMLVGETGAGKESTVRKLALDSFEGKLNGNLYHQKIFQLMVDAFMAGAQNQGELESRLNAIIEEVSHAGNIIIYIPEFQNILGSSSFHLDISGALIPYVKKGAIRIIAAVSPGSYKKFVQPLHSLLGGFSIINYLEPEKNLVLDMLFKKAEEIEQKNQVSLTYKAILAAAEYSDRYAKEKVLPGSAVTLLDDSANVIHLAGKKFVEEQDILDQVAKITKVAVGVPTKIEKETLLNLETLLHKRVVGQDDAISQVSQSIRRLRSGLQNAQKPISFLFLGPTGVGKTETAKALAQVYFGNSERLVRLDMSEFAGNDGMKRLLGSTPGEGDEKGQLTEPVYDTPYSLVLLDEFEKADQKILDLFLQVLDDGRLTDNKGKTVSFINTIIIATSNAASEYIREQIENGTAVDKKFQTSLINFLQEKGIFKPELLNRFDDVITFKTLDQDQIIQIVKMMLVEVTKKLMENDIKANFDNNIIAKIAKEGFDKDFGARPLRRFIQDNIEDIIAQKMLKDEIKRGDSLNILVDKSNQILIQKS